jgi:import inner membrane translocase subunit TIM23
LTLHHQRNKEKKEKKRENLNLMAHGESGRIQDPSQVLRNATFSKNESTPTFSDNNALTASDLLLGAYDPTRLHPLAEIGDKLEYLLLEEDKTTDLPGAETAIPSRGWRDDMCYGTGTTYLSGVWRIFILHFA